MTDKSQVKEITNKLKDGIMGLFESDKYAEYLKTMSRFHSYSTRNTVLIHMQSPGATTVAGFYSWKKFGRSVKGGEKSIKILAPTPLVIKEEKEVVDPETKLPVLDDNGQPVIETTEKKFARFKIVHVYDVSQTHGKPLPTLAQDLEGNVEQYEAFMDALKSVSPLPIVIEPMSENQDGYCRFGEKIGIRKGMSQIQTVSAVIHEITHAKLHDSSLIVGGDESENPKNSRRTEEVEAESISYAVCQYFGIETGDNSFGYVAGWSKGKDLKELNASLDTIRKTATELIEAVEGKFHEIAKERDINLSIGEEQATLSEQAADGIIMEPDAAVSFHEMRPIGTYVLMPLLFNNDGNLERTDKKTRVRIEPPIGKYQVYSREIGKTAYGYFMTESGKLINAGSTYERIKNLEENQIDEFFAQNREIAEKSLQDPDAWVDYTAAAIANRLTEVEAHNAPVKEARAIKREQERQEFNTRYEAEKRQREIIYNGKVDELATALINGERIEIEPNPYTNPNPLFALFDRHKIEIPAATKGWISRTLKAFQLHSDNRLTAWGPKGMKISSTFAGSLIQLKNAVNAATPQQNVDDLSDAPLPTQKERGNTLENKLYQKFSEMFPKVASGEYSYLRLEASGGMEPLSLEWIDDDKISGGNLLTMCTTYTMNGDLMYDPMVTFTVDSNAKTLTAHEFEQSMPPMYQRVEENGNGRSIDGNGRETNIRGLQHSINDYTSQWFDNIEDQGYIPVKANMVIDEDEAIQITFDKEGNPIMPEPEETQKRYDLGFGHLGNGITVWNRLEERNGDYVTVAHIDPDRSITFYDKNMPDDIMAQINNFAQTSDTRASVSQPEKRVFYTPPKIESLEKQIDMSIPDPTLSAENRDAYGYTQDDMFPLSSGRAVELFDTNHTIYLLYPDNTEVMALDRNEIITFGNEGLCGITHADWEVSPVRAAQLAIAANSEGNREAELLYGDGNRFGIYQIRDGIEESRNFRFASMKELEAHGLSVNRSNYELVYTAPLLEQINSPSECFQALNKIYENFNINHPADFTGHSLSVSDVIVLKYGNNISTHYVDAIGFEGVAGFVGNENQEAIFTKPVIEKLTDKVNTYYQLENTSSEYTGPSVAELEADTKNNKPISLTDLAHALKNEREIKRPVVTKGKLSLMDRVEKGKEKAAQQGQLDTNKTKNREV